MPRTKTGLPWADYLNARTSQRKRPLPSSSGLWCPDCRCKHSYQGISQLGFSYRHSDDQLVILWLCPDTGNIISEASYGDNKSAAQ